MPRPCPWLLAWTLACTFDASGQGEAPAASSAGGGVASSGAVETSEGPAPDATTTGDPGGSGSGTADATTSTTSDGALTEPSSTTSTTSTTTTSTTTTGEPGSTSAAASTTTGDPPDTTGEPGPPMCDGMFVKQIRLVAGSQVFPPMITQQSMLGEGTIALSQVAELGTIVFTFDVPCSGTYVVWGRVLDQEPGVNNYDPDSYYIKADGGPESGWFYGCQTDTKPAGYAWLRVRTGAQGIPCDQTVPMVVDLAAGTHTITLRNREQQDGEGNVAAVARMMIVSDPNYTPGPPD